MSILIADNNCDLTNEEINRFGIEYINMPFSLDEKGVSDISVEFFYNALKPYLEQGNNLVYVHRGEQFFKSIANLKQAVRGLKTEFPDNTIYLVDSKATSSSYALMVYLSMVKYKTGCNEIDLVNYIEKIRDEISMVFTLTDSKVLQKHNINVKVDNALIKPLVKLGSGKFECVGKYTNRRQMVDIIFSIFNTYGENVADYPFYISHAGNNKEALELKEEIIKKYGCDVKVYINKLNEFDTYYTNKKALSVSFHTKN